MALDLVRSAGVLVATVIAAVSLYELIRRRTTAALELALYFSGFAVAVGGVAAGILDLPLSWFLLVAASSVSLPYILLRIADHFVPVPRPVSVAALIGLLYSVILNVWLVVVVFRLEGTPSTQPTPDPLASIPMALYLVGVTAYCAWLFARASLQGSGSTTWRARLAALGSLLVGLGIAEMVVLTMSTRSETGAPRTPAVALDAYALLLALAAVTYFLAFASPPWLRQMWRLAELHRFLRATAETSIGERRRESLDALIDATKRATGAADAFVSVGEQAPAASAISVPIATGGRAFGTLHAVFRSEPLFPGHDAAIMRLMAGQTAVALANAELFRERRELEERERRRIQEELERVEQELEIARRIQLSLLPRTPPTLAGWEIAAYYRPAREVGGDLYDFFPLSDGSIAIVIGDASGHGMAAALVMATARSEVRSAGATSVSPGTILERANANLVGAMPPSTFVTCMVVALDPATGRARYANAGHNVPYARGDHGVRELRARGFPLGLLDETRYEESEATIGPDEMLLLYTDGIVEAHGTDGRAMFGSERLRDVVWRSDGHPAELVLRELDAFTGPGWEQEDDITMVSVRRVPTERVKERGRT